MKVIFFSGLLFILSGCYSYRIKHFYVDGHERAIIHAETDQNSWVEFDVRGYAYDK